MRSRSICFVCLAAFVAIQISASAAPENQRTPLSVDLTDLSLLRRAETRQATTFNLEKKTKVFPVDHGKTTVIAETTGTGRISQLWLTFPNWFWRHWEPDQPVDQTMLKKMILRIYWDGAANPAVQAPIGDFFGNGLCEVSNFTSRYFGMSSGGFFCKFPMPFRKGFRVEIENRDKTLDSMVFCNILYQLEEVPPEAAYFHAQYRSGRNKGPEPMRILEAEGSGHYVGCVVSAQGQPKNYLSYLEAPEYIFIDNNWEKPRITGTGLEDYFLGGWYFREGVFTGELHGVPSKNALNSSIAMYRVHEADAVHFRNRIRFEFVTPWSPERLRPFAWSSVAFYYLDRPEGSTPPLPEGDALIPWYRIPETDHQSIP